MALPSSSPVVTLTLAAKAAQAKQAALTAALVAYYYKTRVNVEDPTSIEAWLSLVVPRILADRNRSSRLAAVYGDTLRRLEIPKAADGFKFDPALGTLDAAVVRSSLLATGVGPVQGKLGQTFQPPEAKQALITQAKATASNAVAGATVRHVQGGGREVLIQGARTDKLALGYVRVTDSDPCYFCAMLASRGLVYGNDSFADSNPRFTNGKTESSVKVHDSCGCGMKPAYSRDDPFLEQSKAYKALWEQAGRTSERGTSQALQFRRLIEGRA